MKNKIERFTGEYAFLSNFYLVDVEFKGRVFPSSEHAFMSEKSDNNSWKDLCTDASIPPGKIRRMGRQVTLVADWDEIKFDVMEEVLRKKFHFNPEMKKALIATGKKELIKGDGYGDKIWGVCSKTREGSNHLGKILMTLREEVKIVSMIRKFLDKNHESYLS